MTQQISADAVIAKYVETRDLIEEKKKAFDAEIAKLKALQERREKWLTAEMDRLGLKSFKGDHGTCFFETKDSATVKDAEAFIGWVFADPAARRQFLENRVSKTAVKQALEEGTPPPPGVDYVAVRDIKVRRK